jgi:hypothetical protein
MFRRTIAIVGCLLVGGASRLASAAPEARLAKRYGELPLRFEPNRGQADARVQFIARGLGYDLFVTRDRAVMRLGGDFALGMRLLGTSAGPAAIGEARLPGVVSYLAGNDAGRWRTRLETFAKVRSANVYPGVDLVYYGNGGRLEYDFIVAPGADPSAIRLRFASRGSTPVAIWSWAPRPAPSRFTSPSSIRRAATSVSPSRDVSS